MSDKTFELPESPIDDAAHAAAILALEALGSPERAGEWAEYQRVIDGIAVHADSMLQRLAPVYFGTTRQDVVQGRVALPDYSEIAAAAEEALSAWRAIAGESSGIAPSDPTYQAALGERLAQRYIDAGLEPPGDLPKQEPVALNPDFAAKVKEAERTLQRSNATAQEREDARIVLDHADFERKRLEGLRDQGGPVEDPSMIGASSGRVAREGARGFAA